MNVEDIRYDMISETDFNSRLVDATLQIFTLNKQHRFKTSKYKAQLRDLTNYVQQRIMEMRGYHSPGEPVQPNSNGTSLQPSRPAERFPSSPANSLFQKVYTPSQATPTIDQTKVVGAAAITATHRRHHLVGSGGLSRRTNTPLTNSILNLP